MMGRDEVVVWEKKEWNSGGFRIMTFVIDPEKMTQTPIYKVMRVRREEDGGKKLLMYAKIEDVLAMKGKILKRIRSYASGSKRNFRIRYLLVSENLVELDSDLEKDGQGYYDKVRLGDKYLIIRKNSVTVQK
jgi:hypothetical protein